MQELQEYTAADDEIRSLRVDGLMPMMDAFYLFNCFYDNAEVLAATVLRNVQTGHHEDYGFVEFASHSIADFVLNSYNGELMPNYKNERYCLSWDTDGFGTRWRWDRFYRCCTFFGFDKDAVELDGLAVIQHYMDSIPFFTKIRVPDNVLAYPNKRLNKSKQEEYLELEAVCPPNKRLKSSKEKELYLCFNEINGLTKSCYVVRTVKLSELFACSCEFILESETLIFTKCRYCSAIDQPEHQLRQRAWFPWESTDRHSTTVTSLPKNMGCCASGSRLYLAGGIFPPTDPETVWFNVTNVPSGDVYSFDAESTSWHKHDWSFNKEKPNPLLFEVKGNLYCLARQPMTERPTFEVYDSLSGKCEVLPDPPFYKLEREGGCLMRCHAGIELSYAIVGTKILISSKLLGRQFSPVMCFDVNDDKGETKWREMTSLFDGKGFPFDGRALVLDLNDGTHAMFSFRCDYQMIFVSLLHSLDDGSICISQDRCLGGYSQIHSLMRDFGDKTYDFVDLGDQKVGFVFCGNRQLPVDLNDHDSEPKREARVLVVVIQYKLLDSNFLISKILATRTFDYNCHSPSIFFADLVGSIVV